MNQFYVYSYSEPNSPEPFYIGKGQRNRANDFNGHIRGVENTHIARKLSKTFLEGIQLEIDYLQLDLTNQEAIDIEKQLIKYWGRIDLGTGCLCNHTDGGDGDTHSEETRAKISAALIGHVQSLETIEKLRIAQIGRTHECSLDHRIKMSHKQRSKEATEKIRQSNIASRGRSICSVNPLTGQVIRIFDSVGAALKKCRGAANVLYGRRKLAGGYFWRDATENDVALFKD